MSKLITVHSTRNGVGRTLISSILGLKLSEQEKRVLLIDNNLKYTDLEKYLLVEPEYSVDDVKPYLESKSLDNRTLQALTTKIDKNLEIIGGSKLYNLKNMLSGQEIDTINTIARGTYDYVIVDTRANLLKKENRELIQEADYVITVSRNNQREIQDLLKQIKETEINENNIITSMKTISIVNKASKKKIEGKEELEKAFTKDRVFNLEYSEKLKDFTNGYKLELEEENTKTVRKIVELIAEKDLLKDKDNRGLFAPIVNAFKLRKEA